MGNQVLVHYILCFWTAFLCFCYKMVVHHRAFHKWFHRKTTNRNFYHDPNSIEFLELNIQLFHKYFWHRCDQICFLLKVQNRLFWHSHHDLREHFLVSDHDTKYFESVNGEVLKGCLMRKILLHLPWIYQFMTSKKIIHLLGSIQEQKTICYHSKTHNPFSQ